MTLRSEARHSLPGRVWRMAALASAAGAVAAAVGLAAEAPPAEDLQAEADRVLRLGEMLVDSTSLDRDLLRNLTLESASLEIATSTVEAEDIRLQDAGTWAEALDYSTGVFTEWRGRKEKSLTSFRGQIYPYPDFALNGVWQRSFWEVPSFLPAAAIERIEILRSGGAIMVGPNSGLVGAINVVPRRFDEPTTLFDVQGGSHATFRESVVHGDRFERGYYTVGGSRYSTDGPEGENAAERFGTLFGTAGLEPVQGLRLEATGFLLDGERELRRIQAPGLNALRTRREEYSPYDSQGAILRTLVEHGDRASTEFDLGYVRRSGHYERARQPAAAAHELDWEYNAGILHAVNLTDENTLRLGFQYNHWICPDGKRDFVGKRMDVQTGSVVVMDEHRFDRLTLDAGIRVSRSWYEDYTDTTFNITGTSMSGRAIEDEWGDPAWVATLGAKYQVTDPLALYAHAAAGVVDAPPGAVAAGGGGIDREQRLILDAGFSLSRPNLGTAKLGAFTTWRQDAILLTETRVTEAGETFNTYDNRDVRQYGLEFEGRTARIGRWFSLFSTATVMTSEQRPAGEWQAYGEIPDAVVTGGIYAQAGRFDLNLFGKYVSSYRNRRFAQDGKYHPLGDFLDLNLTGGVSFGRKRATRLYFSLENLLDDAYSTVVGYPDYGFQAFVGVQHRL